LWKEHHSNLDISSLALETISFDVLKGLSPSNHTEAVLASFKDLQERITQNIKHPSKGPQLNKLNESDRKTWSKSIQKNITKLQTYSLDDWKDVIGPEFNT